MTEPIEAGLKSCSETKLCFDAQLTDKWIFVCVIFINTFVFYVHPLFLFMKKADGKDLFVLMYCHGALFLDTDAELEMTLCPVHVPSQLVSVCSPAVSWSLPSSLCRFSGKDGRMRQCFSLASMRQLPDGLLTLLYTAFHHKCVLPS